MILHGRFEAENLDNPLRPLSSSGQHIWTMKTQVPTFLEGSVDLLDLSDNGTVPHFVFWGQGPSSFQPSSIVTPVLTSSL